jgi:hypothetical protein
MDTTTDRASKHEWPDSQPQKRLHRRNIPRIPKPLNPKIISWAQNPKPYKHLQNLKTRIKQGDVSHYGLAIYIKKLDLKAKRRIMETQIFHHAKIIIFKKSSKRNQNSSSYYNSRTNLKFQHKPKYHLSKILLSK